MKTDADCIENLGAVSTAIPLRNLSTNWIFSIRYHPEGVWESCRRAVVGPAHSLTVEAALHLAGVPEADCAEIRADATVRLFVEGRLDPEESGYYRCGLGPGDAGTSWVVCIGSVHKVAQ